MPADDCKHTFRSSMSAKPIYEGCVWPVENGIIFSQRPHGRSAVSKCERAAHQARLFRICLFVAREFLRTLSTSV